MQMPGIGQKEDDCLFAYSTLRNSKMLYQWKDVIEMQNVNFIENQDDINHQ